MLPQKPNYIGVALCFILPEFFAQFSRLNVGRIKVAGNYTYFLPLFVVFCACRSSIKHMRNGILCQFYYHICSEGGEKLGTTRISCSLAWQTSDTHTGHCF